MIIFDKVNLSFAQKQVLKDFSAQFESGKINCILGPSGCGKTTLLNLLAGIIKQDNGEIIAPVNVSYVFQDDLLIPQQTVLKNLEIALKSAYSNKGELKTVIKSLLELSKMQGVENMYPHQLSGGMRQRIALIRAFGFKSEILLMDEPFKALDTSLWSGIINEFLKLYDKDMRTVIFVTHNVDEALLVGDNIFVFDKNMAIMKEFSIKGTKGERKLYGRELTLAKNEIYKQMEKWGTPIDILN